MGKLFSWLAKERNPAHVVEFGTAFGVSGMYWLAGMETGHLHTFEPNPDWAEFAKANLSAISPRFTLTSGTFEDQGPRVLQPGSVDIAFIDAIHTSEFVDRQYEVLKPLMAPGSLILFDDLLFSQDMTDCFDRIAREPHLTASARLGRRVGVIELP
jgi:predicted O-methyltransferase YrrM